VWDAVDNGSATLIPEMHPAMVGTDKVRTCRNCGTDEVANRRYEYLGSLWVNLGCGHFQNDDEH
jgi:hypothetical protein